MLCLFTLDHLRDNDDQEVAKQQERVYATNKERERDFSSNHHHCFFLIDSLTVDHTQFGNYGKKSVEADLCVPKNRVQDQNGRLFCVTRVWHSSSPCVIHPGILVRGCYCVFPRDELVLCDCCCNRISVSMCMCAHLCACVHKGCVTCKQKCTSKKKGGVARTKIMKA